MTTYEPQKIVLEVRYEPKLEFYRRMDEFGETMSSEFRHWERSPLSLELRNRKYHRRLYLSHSRIFFERDNPQVGASECDSGVNYFNKAFKILPIKAFSRIGLRQWFLVNIDKSFPAITDSVAKSFYNRESDVAAITPGTINDLAYVVNYDHKDGWEYNLKVAPMRRDEWFSKVAHEEGIYGSGKEKADKEESFSEYKETIPENFLFIDIDCLYNGNEIELEKLNKLVNYWKPFTKKLSNSVIEMCKRS